MQRLTVLLSLSLLFGSLSFTAQAKLIPANPSRPMHTTTSQPDSLAGQATSATTVTCKGRVSSAAGALPGAVVRLIGTNEMTVTNADGDFTFTVPAKSSPLRASVTYAGFADETATLVAGPTPTSVQLLAPVAVAKVDKQHQLKAYLKTSRKQVKRSLSQVRKSKFRSS